MRYGYFDDANREYVIERPDTPASWSNYIGTRDFGGIITNNAGGYSFYRTAAIGRYLRLHFNAIPADQPGRYFYIRDNESGDYWSTSWQPVGKPLDQYKSTCRFGMGYAVIESEYADIQSRCAYFIPNDQLLEVWRCTLTNNGKTQRKLSLYTYCEFTSEWDIFNDEFNRQYSAYIVQTKFADGFIQHATTPNLPEDADHFANRDQSRWTWMTLRGADVSASILDREQYIGPYRTYANPLVVETGSSESCEAYGGNACGGLKADIELMPGESRDLVVLLGVGHAATDGKKAVEQFGSIEALDDALTDVKAYWHSRMNAMQVETPDPEFNSMTNVWNAYNALITFYWCRAASLVYSGDQRDGYGFRDTVQDCVGAAQMIPEEVGRHLERMLTAQESIGGAMPELKPYLHQPGAMPLTPKEEQRSDDMLWFFNAIPEYVAETGDFEFYKKVVPYSDRGEDTVFAHLKKALLFNLERTGQHGLPCGLHADWDDCIRMGFNGETIFVAFQMCLGFRVYEEVARTLGETGEADWAAREREKMEALIQEPCWDGEWFIRGWKETGEALGRKGDEEAQIFYPIQCWSVISGAATPEQAEQAMQSVDTYLATEYGNMALMPPVVQADCKELRMVLLNPGEKENAGVFNHSQGWSVMAHCMLGHGDRAYRYHRAYMPARFNDRAELRRMEPYVHGQSTDSRYSPNEGRCNCPWLSGTASWCYYSATHYILGIQPDMDGLRINPCIPSDWPEFRVERIYRGKRLRIHVRNPNGHCKGISKLTLNGETIEGNLVPLARMADENEVVCEIDGREG